MTTGSSIKAIEFSRNGKFFVINSTDRIIRVVDSESMVVTRELQGIPSLSLSLSPSVLSFSSSLFSFSFLLLLLLLLVPLVILRFKTLILFYFRYREQDAVEEVHFQF